MDTKNNVFRLADYRRNASRTSSQGFTQGNSVIQLKAYKESVVEGEPKPDFQLLWAMGPRKIRPTAENMLYSNTLRHALTAWDDFLSRLGVSYTFAIRKDSDRNDGIFSLHADFEECRQAQEERKIKGFQLPRRKTHEKE